ncbi:MAG: DUF2061 domain-containing protein [Reichenbachiella sp.]|uniref:DUF2061 domain-containing protein n=1 Tax=Reichenbachiella sp. TaxID=2184521 RepID=UPI002967758F|nr:DUF2061 domain-containing protein [Reichenbachiella sp.]MDW3208227.1 DUF2061 domain-containing protein [Reichenbachiella sp.]
MDSRVRHITKSITWRAIATATTLSVAAYIQGGISGSQLGLLAVLDVVIKLLLYYFHERFWFNLKANISPRIRHIIKAFTWRAIAGLTTFILVVWIFNESQGTLEKAGWIAIVETILKMMFYYGHEEVWYRINLGLDNRKINNQYD